MSDELEHDRDVRSLALPLLLQRSPSTTRRDALRRMLEHAADSQELGSACDAIASFASADEWGYLLAVCNLQVVRRLAAAIDRVPWSVAAPAFAAGDPDREAELVDRIAEPEAIPVSFLVARTLAKASRRDAWSEARVHSLCAGWLRERAERAPALSSDQQSLVEALARSLEATARRTLERLEADEDSLDAESALDEGGRGFDDDSEDDFEDDFEDEQEALKRAARDDYQLAAALRDWLDRSRAKP